jgi:cytochrome c2
VNQFRRSLIIFVTLVAVLSLFLAACGDDDDDDDANGGDSNGAPTATTGGGDEDEATEEDGGDEGEATEGEATEGEADAGGDAAAAGEAIYEAQCASCHSIDGSDGIGPTWQGIMGREETLADGSTVTVDEEYIRESIQDPNAKVVEGFSEGIMPEFDLSDEEIDQLIAFMETL